MVRNHLTTTENGMLGMRQVRGTSDQVQIRVSRKLYMKMKIISGILDKTVPELIEKFLAEKVVETLKSIDLGDVLGT